MLRQATHNKVKFSLITSCCAKVTINRLDSEDKQMYYYI